ncbi:unnamed protein product [Paramecium sonneborni]|uniref:Uncharacterized protein n=1 Tax=Paramecium sonneborni TaxID=65129 RepID=A0A8S1RUA6_9CILI|nr:unnamed protein product [Paramecium sonneborni]
MITKTIAIQSQETQFIEKKKQEGFTVKIKITKKFSQITYKITSYIILQLL